MTLFLLGAGAGGTLATLLFVFLPDRQVITFTPDDGDG